MNLAPAGVNLSFEVTFDSDSLNVAMSVYDTTSGSPILVQGPLAMASVYASTYFGRFTGLSGRTYVLVKAVYTDNTFTTLSPDYAQGSESIAVVDIGGGSGSTNSCAVVGVVYDNNPITNGF